MDSELAFYQGVAEKIEGALSSQMFGKPCYKLGKKAFCCFFENHMVFKLKGDAHTAALSIDGATLFDPSGKGRPMKEWVQIPFTEKRVWQKYAQEAANYVSSM